MPKSHVHMNMYTGDKIRAIFLLPRQNFKGKEAALIIQFWHSIYTVSIGGSNTRRLTESGKMVPEYVI